MKRWPFALLAMLAACSSQPPAGQDQATPSPVPAAVAMAPIPDDFAQCSTCHTCGKDAPDGIGPNLFGVHGRKAASMPGFAYSDALKASGLSWDDATLDQWLTKPQAFVPGTRMTFAGLPDAAGRRHVIDYLKTLK